MENSAKEYINKLQLRPHPEGGYFKEIYRSGEIFEAEHLPGRYEGDRSFSTSIYFLLEGRQFSSFHKLRSMNCGIIMTVRRLIFLSSIGKAT